MKKLTEALIVIGITLLLVAIFRNGLDGVEERNKHKPMATPEPAAPTTPEPYNPPAYEPYDFVMMSVTAKSNAVYFGKPPEGWDVVCDGNGRYAPRSGRYVFDTESLIRTNHSESIVATWRAKEVLEGIEEQRKAEAALPKPTPINWKPCE